MRWCSGQVASLPRFPDTFIFTSATATEYAVAAWSVAVVGLLLSFGSFWLTQQQLSAHKLLEFKWVAENRHRALKKEIDSELKAVESIRDLVLVSGEVSQDDFRAGFFSAPGDQSGDISKQNGSDQDELNDQDSPPADLETGGCRGQQRVSHKTAQEARCRKPGPRVSVCYRQPGR